MKLRGALAAGVLLTACSLPSGGQGCAQCRDNAAATPPATQRAYRHAIALLAVTGGGLFAGTVFLLKKQQ